MRSSYPLRTPKYDRCDDGDGGWQGQGWGLFYSYGLELSWVLLFLELLDPAKAGLDSRLVQAKLCTNALWHCRMLRLEGP